MEFYYPPDPEDFDNEALDAVEPHTEVYWRLACSVQAPVEHNGQPPTLPDPGDPDHHDGFHGYRWTVDNYDIRFASHQLATLLFGPDNGSMNRDDIECQMQKVMKMSFDWTAFGQRLDELLRELKRLAERAS
jgi:hypothetical protein